MSLPLDADGFMRRECPSCEREFKWHHGKTDAAPDDFVFSGVYYCPLCGRPAGEDSWWTPAQLEYQQQIVASKAGQIVADELKKAFKPRRGSLIKFDVKNTGDADTPDPLVEPDDMVMIAPPCHSWEPVKVPEDAHAPFHCLLCGSAYSV